MFTNNSQGDNSPVTQGDNGGGLIPLSRDVNGKPTIDARALHAHFEAGKMFANWIKDLIKRYDFKEGRDFTTESRLPNLASGNRGASIEYHLSIHMAKAISMVSRGPRAKEARDYFVACEEKLLEILSRPTGDKLPHEMSLKENIAYNKKLLQMSEDAMELADMYKASYHEQTNNLITVVVAGQAKDRVISEKDDQIKTLEPKAKFADTVMAGKDTYSLSEAAKLAKIPKPPRGYLGRNGLKDLLVADGYIMNSPGGGNEPKQEHVNNELFEYGYSAPWLDSLGNPRRTPKTHVKPKGLNMIITDYGGKGELLPVEKKPRKPRVKKPKPPTSEP